MCMHLCVCIHACVCVNVLYISQLPNSPKYFTTDVKVLISMLQCMDILLNHMMETKQSESTTASLLIR